MIFVISAYHSSTFNSQSSGKYIAPSAMVIRYAFNFFSFILIFEYNEKNGNNSVSEKKIILN